MIWMLALESATVKTPPFNLASVRVRSAGLGDAYVSRLKACVGQAIYAFRVANMRDMSSSRPRLFLKH